MASIIERKGKNGNISYQVIIRFKGIEIFKTFFNEDDAKLYSEYKENLIQNMENFSVNIEDRVTISSLFDMKINQSNDDRRSFNSYKYCLQKINEFFKDKIFIHQITFEDWIEYCKWIFSTPVYRGAKNENGKRNMSVKTLRTHFAYISSAISSAQKKGFKIDNLPLKVIQTHINKIAKG